MTPYIVVIVLIIGSWALLLLTFGFAQAMTDRRVGASLEVREWEAFVQAMRQITDQEGPA